MNAVGFLAGLTRLTIEICVLVCGYFTIKFVIKKMGLSKYKVKDEE